MSTEALILAQGVGLNIRGRAILSEIDLTLCRNQIVTLIGPNGAGKSSLIRVLLGLLPAQQGRVWRKPGLRIGYMPQRLHIDETLPLTVERFITLGAAASRTKVQHVLAETGADALLNSPLQGISGGEFQRVLLARALLREPELLVLDEPVQAVDVAGQYELYRLIGDLRQRYGCGILMVSHDLHLVMAATDQVICLNGHVCCSGHPDSVARDPAYLRLFGLDGRHVAVYQHHHDHHHTLHGDIQSDQIKPDA